MASQRQRVADRAASIAASMSDAALQPMARQLQARAAATPFVPALMVYPAGAVVPSTSISWSDWYAASSAVALELLKLGVERGDRIAILAGNRPVWPIVDIAVQLVGAIGVGIYPTSSISQITQLLEDATPKVAFASGETHIAAMREAIASAHQAAPHSLTLIGEFFGTRHLSGDAVSRAWDQLLVDGAEQLVSNAPASRALRGELEERVRRLSLDDLAALIYTSGSTGVPKGACISHRYLAASAASIVARLDLNASDRALSFLPYSHAAERVFGQCTRIATGMSSALIEDATDVFTVAAHFEPTLFGGLPRLFERLYEAVEVARRTGADPRDAIAARIGTACRLATSGGAAMPIAVAEELAALGLPILGAYGQTEHLCVAMNEVQHLRFDTVGRPMPGTTVRITADSELLIERSSLTFSGYWQKPAETAAAFTADGRWLQTGDLATLESDGSLRITGRVKELIALSTGRKIAPLPIEAALAASPFVAHAVCFGEGRKYLVALITLRRDVVEAWARERQLDAAWPGLAHAPAVRALVDDVVAGVNGHLAKTDRVQRIAIVDAEFSVESGALTPTFKVMRRVIAERFAAEFAALYD